MLKFSQLQKWGLLLMTGLSLKNFSLWCILYVHPRKLPICLLDNNYGKMENPQGRHFYLYENNISNKKPLHINIWRIIKWHIYAKENYKMLHDRPIWNIFLQILEYISTIILCMILASPHFFKNVIIFVSLARGLYHGCKRYR